MSLGSLSWRIGGAQGTGIDSAALIFARACAYAGYHVYGEREYHSNIKGLHSYFNVVVDEKRVRSVMDKVHVLASLDAETIAIHAWSVTNEGVIIYDSHMAPERIDSIPTLSSRLKTEILERLRKEGFEDTIEGVLEEAKDRGVKLIPINYLELLREVGEKIGVEKAGDLMRANNILVVTASAAALQLNSEHLKRAVEERFRGRRELRLNLKVVEELYPRFRERLRGILGRILPDLKVREERYLLPGFASAALGKLVGGCRFQAYYPITPAQDESFLLEEWGTIRLRDGRESSMIVIQTEDEISALGMALGASLAGARSATATSGPGFSLMIEALGWAGMNEVPVVITLYQRCGPSTGMPTRHEQGDLLSAVFGGHGEFPKIVVASGDVEEAFYDAALALNYAERYQLPVIHLLDKCLANSIQTVPKLRVDSIRIKRRLLPQEEHGEYKRFKFTESGVSPMARLGDPHLFWGTGNEHDEFGHVTEDPVTRVMMMEKRMKKLRLAAEEIPEEEKVRVYGNDSAEVGIVGWGSTKGPILDAMEVLKEEGIRTRFVQVRMLYPFPSEPLRRFAKTVRKLIFVEQNYSGQLAKLAAMEAGIRPDNLILKFNGRSFSYQELAMMLKRALTTGEERIVSSRRWEA